jgi:GNAT superfamily N-acetyltransferase
MSTPLQIEPVPPAAQRQALQFLLAGARSDVLIASRAEALQQLLRKPERRSDLWWALAGRQCVAAAMVVHNPGRSALLLHTPAEAPGVDRQALASVARAAALQGLQDGALLVQVMVEDGCEADLAMVQAAGFAPLARLVHMRLNLGGSAVGESPGLATAASPGTATGRAVAGWRARLRWRSAEQFSQDELGRVIAATYEGSLDCPMLAGVRSIDDVITCHKASGVFRPQSWWLVDVDGAAAGCVLINDSATGSFAEIVYLGVIPHFRGRGIGRRMLRHAADDARARRLESIDLAVDDQNIYALRAYTSEGYRVTRRQWAYVMLHEGPGRANR